MQIGGSEAELDIEQPERLVSYLHATGRLPEHEQPKVTLLFGGVSNRTVLVEHSRGAWVLKQALPKLRVAVDWFSDPARIEREAAGLRILGELAPPGSIPPLIFEDREHHLLAMAAVPQPHENMKKLWLGGGLERWHVEQFATLLGTIHGAAWQRRDELADTFADRRFFESLRLEPYYAYTATQQPSAAAFLHALIDETRRHRLTLVHGDYSPKNVLVHDGRLVLLDHEVIHWGDPAFDVGFALTHILSKAHHLRQQRCAFADAAVTFWSAYDQALGDVPWRDGLQEMAVRHTLGCLLARVCGRSPLEYLSDAERRAQCDVVIALMRSPPHTVADLTTRFIGSV